MGRGTLTPHPPPGTVMLWGKWVRKAEGRVIDSLTTPSQWSGAPSYAFPVRIPFCTLIYLFSVG